MSEDFRRQMFKDPEQTALLQINQVLQKMCGRNNTHYGLPTPTITDTYQSDYVSLPTTASSERTELHCKLPKQCPAEENTWRSYSILCYRHF